MDTTTEEALALKKSREEAYLHWLEYKTLLLERQKRLIENYRNVNTQKLPRKVTREIRADTKGINLKYVRVIKLTGTIKRKSQTQGTSESHIHNIEEAAFEALQTALESLKI